MTNKERQARKSYETAMATASANLARRTAMVPSIRLGNMPPLRYQSYNPEAANAEYAEAAAAARAVYNAAVASR